MSEARQKRRHQPVEELQSSAEDVEILEVVGLEEEGSLREVPPVQTLDEEPYELTPEQPPEVKPVADQVDRASPAAAGAGTEQSDDVVELDDGQSDSEGSSDRERLNRLQADFDNLKRRGERERERFKHRATVTLISRLLPVLDNFERALASGPDPNNGEALRDGIVLIFRQLLDELRKEGLESIEAIGQTFDPEVHEAVETEIGSGNASNQIVAELQRGYRLQGHLLRPALVKVSIETTEDR